MEKQYVMPAPGLKVRDPQTRRHIADVGQWVPLDQFWLRRLADGDVVAATEPATPEESPK